MYISFVKALRIKGFEVEIQNFTITNVVCNVKLPWKIDLKKFHKEHERESEYEPENKFPAVVYKFDDEPSNVKGLVFHQGSVIVSGATSDDHAIEKIKVLAELLGRYQIGI